MKKIFLLPAIILLGLLLTGCSFSLTPGTKKATVVTTDGGVYKSADFGEVWQQKVNVMKNGTKIGSLASLQPFFIVFDPIQENIVYLSTKSNGIFKSTDNGETWTQTIWSSGAYSSLTIDPRNPKVIYTIKGNTIVKSVDGLQSSFTTYIESRPSQTLVDVCLDSGNPSVIYAASTTSLLKSTNYGNDWKLLTWQKPQILNLYISTKSPSTLYALTKGGLFKSTDAGASWLDLTDKLSAFKDANIIYWFNFDPITEYIFLGTKFGILKSIDGGNAWQEIPTLFEYNKIAIKNVVYNPNNLNEIIFSVNNVLHKSTNNGASWQALKSIPTSRSIVYLKADPYHKNVIFAGIQQPTKK